MIWGIAWIKEFLTALQLQSSVRSTEEEEIQRASFKKEKKIYFILLP
jgi:hypothetical protein